MVIDPGRRDVRVSQLLLYRGDVSVVIERIGRGRRPQRMRPDLEAELG